MAEISPPSLSIISHLGIMSLTFLVYHCYKFDRFQCLIPRKKDWYRCLLTWMLFLSNMCFVGWAVTWATVKYALGWVNINPANPKAARPWPSIMFPAKYQTYNGPLTVMLSISYALQASLTAQETLYWLHLQRSTRRPHAAKPFLKSYYFYTWIVVTLVVSAVQIAAPWIAYKGNAVAQLALELLVSGILETIVWLASAIVMFKFPQFLADVKATGAGPEVQQRLFFYHELNAARTFLRVTFTVPLLILGADGLTSSPVVNESAIAGDLLSSLTALSFCLVMMISIVLYLPRSSPSAAFNHVMVGQVPAHQPLLTLLREGGQWDDSEYDVDPKARRATTTDDAPFAQAEADGKGWNVDGEDDWKGPGAAGGSVPVLLETFTSPIAVSTRPQPQRPVQIMIEVESEVHRD